MNESVCIYCLTVIVQLILWITRPRMMDGFAMFCIRVLGGIGIALCLGIGFLAGLIEAGLEKITHEEGRSTTEP